MCIEREYWKQKCEIDKLEEENNKLKDKLNVTNRFIKEFLDLVRENKIKLTIPEVNIDLSTDCGPYDTDEELLREILDVYHNLTKNKDNYE